MKRETLLIALAAAVAGNAEAQDYRIRVDARIQSVSFRGLESDSVLASLVDSTAGGFVSGDGHAVRCTGGTYCFFFRPGPALRGIPFAISASLAMWGFGVEGLSLRASGRLFRDLGGDDVWPATEPAAQLMEGYAQYQRSSIIARAGRQLLSSRLEAMGFDGGWLRYRFDRLSLELTGYGGWGLGQAAVVGPNSPALNPLDEFRPRDRQLVAGAEGALLLSSVDLRAEYRREIDPEDDYFVSERAALSFASTMMKNVRVNGGIDYNIAEGRAGTADLSAAYVARRFSVSAGARRYRPYFSLWTLWGAFSPVPYKAANVAAQVRARDWLTLNTRAERYSYDEAEVSTALVPNLQDEGWRVRFGANAKIGTRATIDGSYGLERGPGASARSADASVGFAATRTLSFDVYGGSLARPLELRYYDATSKWIGGRAQWQPSDQRRLWADVSYVIDDRDRPDAAVPSLDQMRMRAGVSFTFGSGADRSPLPPAKPAMR
jgi:hypothetical protein